MVGACVGWVADGREESAMKCKSCGNPDYRMLWVVNGEDICAICERLYMRLVDKAVDRLLLRGDRQWRTNSVQS